MTAISLRQCGFDGSYLFLQRTIAMLHVIVRPMQIKPHCTAHTVPGQSSSLYRLTPIRLRILRKYQSSERICRSVALPEPGPDVRTRLPELWLPAFELKMVNQIGRKSHIRRSIHTVARIDFVICLLCKHWGLYYGKKLEHNPEQRRIRSDADSARWTQFVLGIVTAAFGRWKDNIERNVFTRGTHNNDKEINASGCRNWCPNMGTCGALQCSSLLVKRGAA